MGLPSLGLEPPNPDPIAPAETGEAPTRPADEPPPAVRRPPALRRDRGALKRAPTSPTQGAEAGGGGYVWNAATIIKARGDHRVVIGAVVALVVLKVGGVR